MPASEATIWAVRLGVLALPLAVGVLTAESVARSRQMPAAARVWSWLGCAFAAASGACFAAAAVLYLFT